LGTGLHLCPKSRIVPRSAPILGPWRRGSVRNRVSRGDVVELSEELFGARISTGTVDAILTRASAALADPYDDLLARVRRARALNVDETGWRTAGVRRALWGAAGGAGGTLRRVQRGDQLHRGSEVVGSARRR
jgi:Transposase IS66 family